MEEDRLICEAVQRRLSSGAYTSGVLSPRHERGVAAFQQLVREALQPAAPEAAAGQRPPSSAEFEPSSSAEFEPPSSRVAVR